MLLIDITVMFIPEPWNSGPSGYIALTSAPSMYSGSCGPGTFETTRLCTGLASARPVDANTRIAAPNTDEGRRTLVDTSGLFVTREAAEALSQRTSARAADVAGREARSPERMAQAREHARRALARLLAQPLTAAGLGEVRVVVTFPPERGAQAREHWDASRSPDQVMKDIEARDAPKK